MAESPSLPLLGLDLPTREVRGARDVADLHSAGLFTGPAEPAEVILRREHGDDAHFCPYYPADPEDRAAYPRVHNAFAYAEPDALVTSWLCYDLDNPGHEPHATHRSGRELVDRLWLLESPCRPHATYSTRRGARLMFALAEPLALPLARRAYFAVAELLRQAGLAPDLTPGIAPPAGVRRAPKVTRDGRRTWEEPWFALRLDELGERPRLEVDASWLEAHHDPSPRARHRPEPPSGAFGDCPDPQELEDLLDQLDVTPAGQATLREVRRRLQNRRAEAFLWGSAKLAPDEGPGRSSATHELVGELVTLLYPIPSASPELILALAYPQVAQWTPDEDPSGPRDWIEHAWEAVTRYWGRQVAEDPDPEGTRAGRAAGGPLAPGSPLERQETLLGSMSRGLRLHDPDFPEDPGEAHAAILRRLIAVRSGGEMYLLRPDGLYDARPVDSAALIPAWRDSGLHEVASLERPTRDGMAPRSPADLVREHGTRVGALRVRHGVESLAHHPGGRVVREHRDAAWTQVLEVSTFRLKHELGARRDPDVEAWLEALAGEHLDDLLRWLAYAPDFHGGATCALYLHGPPGAGKQLLCRGLVELTGGEAATGAEFGRFRSALARTPWILVNEGFPRDVARQDRADVFRQFVGGDPIRVEEKYRAPYDVRCPMRVVFTANNLRLLEDLAGGRDLSRDDRAALEQRVLVVPIPESAPRYLQGRGGRAHTEGWVDSEGGAEGQRRVARHVLWLYEQRARWPRGERFLVEGRVDPEARGALLRQSGVVPLIVEALVEVFDRPGARPGVELEKGGAFWVTSHAITKVAREIARRAGPMAPPSSRRVGDVLQSFVTPGGWSRRRADGNRWHQLDPELVRREAESLGLSSQGLRSFSEATKVPKSDVTNARSLVIEKLRRRRATSGDEESEEGGVDGAARAGAGGRAL